MSDSILAARSSGQQIKDDIEICRRMVVPLTANVIAARNVGKIRLIPSCYEVSVVSEVANSFVIPELEEKLSLRSKDDLYFALEPNSAKGLILAKALSHSTTCRFVETEGLDEEVENKVSELSEVLVVS